jgi:hypothetical protein
MSARRVLRLLSGAQICLVAPPGVLSARIGEFLECDATAQLADTVHGIVDLGPQ